jgi:hypothetical protein
VDNRSGKLGDVSTPLMHNASESREAGKSSVGQFVSRESLVVNGMMPFRYPLLNQIDQNVGVCRSSS